MRKTQLVWMIATILLIIPIVEAVFLQEGTELAPTSATNVTYIMGHNYTFSLVVVYNDSIQLNDTIFKFLPEPISTHVNLSLDFYSDTSVVWNVSSNLPEVNVTYNATLSVTGSGVGSVINASVFYNESLAGWDSLNGTTFALDPSEAELEIGYANHLYTNFYDEETNQQISNLSIDLEVWGDDFAQNYSFTGGNWSTNRLPLGEYELIYDAVGYTSRSYFVTMGDNTNQTHRLYLLLDASATRITATVEDTTGDVVPDVLTKAQRKFLDCNCFRTVEMAKTDFQGEEAFNLVMYDVPYMFVLERNSTTLLTTEARKLSSTTIYFTISLLEDILESLRWTWGFTSSIRFDNATSEISFTYNDATGNRISRGCLNVTRRTTIADFDVCSNCVDATGSTLLCTIDTTQTGTWFAQGIVETATNHSTYVIENLVIDASSAHLTYGAIGIFVTMIFVLVVGMIGYFYPPVGIVLAVIGMALGSLMGFAYISYTSIVILAFIAIVIILKIGK